MVEIPKSGDGGVWQFGNLMWRRLWTYKKEEVCSALCPSLRRRCACIASGASHLSYQEFNCLALKIHCTTLFIFDSLDLRLFTVHGSGNDVVVPCQEYFVLIDDASQWLGPSYCEIVAPWWRSRRWWRQGSSQRGLKGSSKSCGDTVSIGQCSCRLLRHL